MTPAGNAVMYVVFFGGALGIDTRSSLAYVLFSLAFSIWVTSFLVRGKIQILFSVKRYLPRFVTVDKPLSYRVVIQNTSGQLLEGLNISERLKQTYPTKTEIALYRPKKFWNQFNEGSQWHRRLRRLRAIEVGSVAIPRLLPGQSTEVLLTLQPTYRGIESFDCFEISREEPLGLWKEIRDLPAPDSITVLPRVYPVHWPNFPGKRHHQQGGVLHASRVGDSEEFRALRDYRPGDPLRAIHWKSWARTGQPIVKEYQEEYFARYALVFDTVFTSEDYFEASVSAAASFVVTQPGADTLLDLLFVTSQSATSSERFDTHCVTAGRGLGNTEDLMRVLATVKPSRPESFGALARTVLEHAAGIGGIILVLQTWDTPRSELVKTLKEKGIAVRVYAPQNIDFPDFVPEGRRIEVSKLKEILSTP